MPAPPAEALLEKSLPAASTVAYALDHHDPEMETRPRVLVTALGSDSPRMAETIDATCAISFTDGLFPIVVTSVLDTAFLVNAPMPIETLPCRSDLGVLSRLEYAQYVERRWTIILGKWGVSETIDLGQDFTAFLADQLAQDIS